MIATSRRFGLPASRIAGLVVVSLLAALAIWRVKVYATGAPTAVPLAIEGTLTDAAGRPATGLWNFTLYVFDVESGGSARATCTLPGARVDAGHFTLPLGSASVCVSVFRDMNNTWIEMEATNGTDTVRTARSTVHAVPYALEADRATTAASATQAAGALESRIAALEARVARSEATRAARVWILDPPVGGLYYDRDSAYNVSNVERIDLGRYRITFLCPFGNYSVAASGPCETCRFSVAGIDARSVEVRVNEDAIVDGGIISRRMTVPPVLVTVLIAGTPLASSTCTPP